MPAYRSMLWVLPLLLAAGCVQRTMTLTSDPPGALVYLNGQEVGRTPLTRSFTWYGNYDVELRREGYDTLKTHTCVVAPFWQWVPLDLVTEVLPLGLKDRQQFGYTLAPAATQPTDPEQLIGRAQELRAMLQSSQYTRQPATRPAE